MYILPAIDIKDGACVRLVRGEFDTAHKVADDPIATAVRFERAGAKWLHMVDLDGAKSASPRNRSIIIETASAVSMKTEVGGGIRNMETIDYYLSNGIDRVILGSAALQNPQLVRDAVAKYGDAIAVGIDARNGLVAAEGWLETSTVDYIDLAREMEALGVHTLIFTDISKDGTLSGPNLEQLNAINEAVSCDIIASGGVATIADIDNLNQLGVSGAICGKSLYSGTLNLEHALRLSRHDFSMLAKYFQKSDLIPAIITDCTNGDVLMLAYMNEQSMRLSLVCAQTWFYSRSRQQLWNKGATSGHFQKIISIHSDCDDDTLLIKVEQTGAACHTGSRSCFFNEIELF